MTDVKLLLVMESSHQKQKSSVGSLRVRYWVLFLVLILDIVDNVSQGTKVSSFADDTRASRGMKTSQDPVHLQKDIESIYKWASKMNMELMNALGTGQMKIWAWYLRKNLNMLMKKERSLRRNNTQRILEYNYPTI